MKPNHQTIQSLFEDTLFYDEPYTAHFIYFAVKKGKVNMQDSEYKLYEMNLTVEEHEEIRGMKKADVLSLCERLNYTPSNETPPPMSSTSP